MATYVTGLLLDGERKSIEPIATRLVDDPAETDWAQVETLDDTTLEQRLYGPRVYLRLPGASEIAKEGGCFLEWSRSASASATGSPGIGRICCAHARRQFHPHQNDECDSRTEAPGHA